MRSADHNIIELDLDISTDRRQAKLKRPTYNLGRANWEKLHEKLTRTEPSSLSRNPRETTTEFTYWITKACDKTIPKTYINGWEITWWTSDLTKMKKQTHLYRRRLNKTLDLEAREKAQNTFKSTRQQYEPPKKTPGRNTSRTT
ncbi:hypothetical protein HN011_002043 [Eciton burchellii]|nr:hypothetical protein HN011_002043 [Eciton burchellii]